MKYCPGDEIYGMIVANPGFPGRNSGYPGTARRVLSVTRTRDEYVGGTSNTRE